MGNNGYSTLARFYDRLSKDIDYSSIAKFTLEIYERFKNDIPEILLDLACGTGSLSIEFSKKKIEVIGIDSSEDMLSRAYDKNRGSKASILFLKQDMCDFELFGTVDLIVCYFDSVNHVLDINDLKGMFKRAANYLNPGGLFIFDVNSLYKFEIVYADNVYFEIYDDLEYIWQNKYDPVSKTITFDLTFFEREKDGRYVKSEETIIERFYSDKELIEVYKEFFELRAKYDGFSFQDINEDSQRLLYILKSRKTFSND